ncbi:MAG: hypothetical protein R2852_04180 [Bacteroidia bacterium]
MDFLINSGKIDYFTNGGNQFARIAANNLFLTGGQKYGFYYTTDVVNGTGGDIMLQNGGCNCNELRCNSFWKNLYLWTIWNSRHIYNLVCKR